MLNANLPSLRRRVLHDDSFAFHHGEHCPGNVTLMPNVSAVNPKGAADFCIGHPLAWAVFEESAHRGFEFGDGVLCLLVGVSHLRREKRGSERPVETIVSLLASIQSRTVRAPCLNPFHLPTHS